MLSSYKTCKLKQWPAHKIYWHNGGTNVTEVTNHFVIRFKAHAMRQIEPIPDTGKAAKNVESRQATGETYYCYSAKWI